jgi:hypothetical protein
MFVMMAVLEAEPVQFHILLLRQLLRKLRDQMLLMMMMMMMMIMTMVVSVITVVVSTGLMDLRRTVSGVAPAQIQAQSNHQSRNQHGDVKCHFFQM